MSSSYCLNRPQSTLLALLSWVLVNSGPESPSSQLNRPDLGHRKILIGVVFTGSTLEPGSRPLVRSWCCGRFAVFGADSRFTYLPLLRCSRLLQSSRAILSYCIVCWAVTNRLREVGSPRWRCCGLQQLVRRSHLVRLHSFTVTNCNIRRAILGFCGFVVIRGDINHADLISRTLLTDVANTIHNLCKQWVRSTCAYYEV